MFTGLAAWSDCGVSPLRNKDRGFSRARCHSAVALYRALRATRALLHPERGSEGVGRGGGLKNRTRLVQGTTGSHDCDDLKQTHSPPEKLFFFRARETTCRGVPGARHNSPWILCAITIRNWTHLNLWGTFYSHWPPLKMQVFLITVYWVFKKCIIIGNII